MARHPADVVLAKPKKRVVGATTLTALLAVLAALSTRNIGATRATTKLQNQLAWLDHELVEHMFVGYYEVMSEALNEFAGIQVPNPGIEPCDDPWENMNTFEGEVRRAQHWFRALRTTRKEFRTYRDAYYAVAIYTNTSKIVVESWEAFNNASLDFEEESDERDAAQDDYDDAYRAYRRAIQCTLSDLADALVYVSVVFFLVGCAMVGAMIYEWRQTDQMGKVVQEKNEALVSKDVELVSKDVELAIQKKILAQFSHEVRNKYASACHMLEYVDALVRGSSVDAAPDLFTKLTSLLDDMALGVALLHEADALVATRLDLHKIYTNNYVSNVDTVDVAPLLQSRVDAARPLAARGVVFEIGCLERHRGCAVRLDQFIFNHVANNCLSNSRKHTTAGVVRLSFLGPLDDGLLGFAVSDSGRGIPDTLASRLFKEEVASADERGVGLGLVSCRQFAEAIGGRVWLHSTKLATIGGESSGSEFRFCLPGTLLPKKEDELAITTMPHGTLPANLRVYVVEDSALIRRSVITKLQRVAKLNGDSNNWTFVEHATVESMLPVVTDDLPNDAIVTVDENLDSQGGILKGADLIRALVAASFRGIIVSCSGDDVMAESHIALGAHLKFGKPLPSVDTMFVHLGAAFDHRATATHVTFSQEEAKECLQ